MADYRISLRREAFFLAFFVLMPLPPPDVIACHCCRGHLRHLHAVVFSFSPGHAAPLMMMLRPYVADAVTADDAPLII